MRHLVLVAALAAVFACKPRNPDEGGLLSDDAGKAPVQTSVAPGGQFHLHCQPADEAADATTYDVDVAGAVDEKDESQDVLVSVARTAHGATDVLADKLEGRGALSVQGPVFVGFPMGVLTADPQAGGKPGAHMGVLTLANDLSASGLKVSCAVEKRPPGAPGA